MADGEAMITPASSSRATPAGKDSADERHDNQLAGSKLDGGCIRDRDPYRTHHGGCRLYLPPPDRDRAHDEGEHATVKLTAAQLARCNFQGAPRVTGTAPERKFL